MNKSNLNSSIIALGAFSACVAVAAGAFAAHGLKDVLNTEYLNTFRTAADYQLAHSIGLILIGIVNQHDHNRCNIASAIFMFVPAHFKRDQMAGFHHPCWRYLLFNRMVNAWF
jgi:uncharacterized membrane protein YgdD (TMEM256/DUF423 family)